MKKEILTATKQITHVDRKSFLRQAFPDVYSTYGEQEEYPSPSQAGVSAQRLRKVAEGVIRKHALICAGTSGGLSVTGFTGMFVALPADVAQYHAHLIMAAQKIAYIYGLQDLAQADDQAQYECLIAMLYIMMGQTLSVGLSNVLKSYMKPFVMHVLKNRGSKQVLQRVVEFAVTKIGGEMLTKKGITRVCSKAIPCVSAGVSFALTWGFFSKGCHRLLNYFEAETLATAGA